MSDKKKGQNARLIAGKPIPTPEFRYQTGWGKSGCVSVRDNKGAQRTFKELQNFVLKTS